jgi:hypothetical protein
MRLSLLFSGAPAATACVRGGVSIGADSICPARGVVDVCPAGGKLISKRNARWSNQLAQIVASK